MNKNNIIKYIVCSLSTFTLLFFNLNVMACSVNSKCVNNRSVNSDCMSGNKFATVSQAFERYLTGIEHPDYSEYKYEMILSRECPGSYSFSYTRYCV